MSRSISTPISPRGEWPGRRRSTFRQRRARQEIILDSKGLEIQQVADGGGRPLQWALGQGDERRGQPLTVRIGEARRIAIRYRSAPDAEALQWLTPAQTAGVAIPICSARARRSSTAAGFPTQDSPGIRQTWEARITAPEPLKVVMSGERLTPEGEPAGEGRRAFRFRMNHPVAPYLIAIAAGDLAFRELGPRTGVWTEPAMLDARRARAGRHRAHGRRRRSSSTAPIAGAATT